MTRSQSEAIAETIIAAPKLRSTISRRKLSGVQ